MRKLTKIPFLQHYRLQMAKKAKRNRLDCHIPRIRKSLPNGMPNEPKGRIAKRSGGKQDISVTIIKETVAYGPDTNHPKVVLDTLFSPFMCLFYTKSS